MFEDRRDAPTLGAPKPPAPQVGAGYSDAMLKAMNVEELLSLRARIDQNLPPMTIDQVDMEQELLIQLMSLRHLSAEVSSVGGTGPDGEARLGVPLNQRAQLANSITTVLKSLIDRQLEVFSSERFKRLENLLIKHLRRQDSEFARAFLDEYEAIVVGKR